MRGIVDASFVEQIRKYSLVGMTCGGYFTADCNLKYITEVPGRDPLSIIVCCNGDQHDLLVEHLLKMRAKVQVQYENCTLLECVVCTSAIHMLRATIRLSCA